MSILLNCLIVGENPYENVFPIIINISEVSTIGLLRESIKEKQPRTFANVDSKELKLWKVDIPLNKLNIVNTKFNIEDKFSGVKQLSPLDEFSEEFASQPPKKHLHLIVQASGDDVIAKDFSKMKNEPQSTSNINEINRCESRFSVVTISIQSMISTTTALPNQSTFSWIYEKIKNAFKFGNQAEQTPEEVISDVLKECSAKSPVTNANGTNRCESRFALVNYCQQYMVTTTTET